jgi:hypothetical protein
MSLEPCAVIHLLWLEHTPNQAILSELEEVYSKDVITLRAVETRIPAFDAGRQDLADLPRFERPRDTGKANPLRALIEGDGYLYQKKIAQMRAIHHELVKRILRDDLNIRKVNFKWVPYALEGPQKTIQVQVS